MAATKILDHISEAFKESEIQKYDLIQKNNDAIYIVYVDFTSLVGKSGGVFRGFAAGEISEKQNSHIFELYNKGICGELVNNENQCNIDKDLFLKSFKIIVMHHYIFRDKKGLLLKYSMDLKNRMTVLKNMELSHFDILLCGHKHVAESRNSIMKIFLLRGIPNAL